MFGSSTESINNLSSNPLTNSTLNSVKYCLKASDSELLFGLGKIADKLNFESPGIGKFDPEAEIKSNFSTSLRDFPAEVGEAICAKHS